MKQKNELKAFLAENNVDLILISEAQPTPYSTYRIPGYSTYHCDHLDGTAHAGSAIIIKFNINHAILPQFQTIFLQATNILKPLNNISTIISSVYSPPGH